MLYDGAIQSADTALEAIASDKMHARKAAVSKMVAIVGHLQSTLDMERGGDVSENLDRIYSWAVSRLLDSTVKRDPKPIEEVRRVLHSLREAWQTIASDQLAGTRP
jgi:flagellar protein FliS